MKELQHFKSVQIATNGDFLNDRTAKALLHCSFVSLSLHEFTYPTRKPRLDLFRAAKNNGTETQVSILETLIPEGQKQGFVDAWLEHADRVRIYVEHSHRGFGDVELSNQWSLSSSLPCYKPFNEMVIYWDGKVALCNHDWCNQEPLGDLNQQTIEEVWNGQAYHYIRELNSKGERYSIPSCETCDQFLVYHNQKRMFGELYTLTVKEVVT